MAKPTPMVLASMLEDRALKVKSRDSNTSAYLILAAEEIRTLYRSAKKSKMALSRIEYVYV